MSKEMNETKSYMRRIGFSYRAAFDANSRVTYQGWAYPSPSLNEDSEKWQIGLNSYDASQNLDSFKFASGNDNYDKKWSSRTTYVYS